MSKRSHPSDEHPHKLEAVHKRRDTDRHKTVRTFPVLAPREYSGHCPSYRQPVEIASYSIDADRRVWFDDRELVLAFQGQVV